MFFQFDVLTGDAIIGLGLMFCLALVFSLITHRSVGAFIVWLTIFNAFVVWGGLLPLWTLVLMLIILTIVIYLEATSKKSEGA